VVAVLLVLAACVSVPQPMVSRGVEAGDVSSSTEAPAVGRLPPPRGDLATASDETEGQRRARIRLELAGAYFSQGQSNTALDEVKRALSFDPNSAAAYNLRGLIYASLSEPGLAEDSFRRSLQLAPTDADTHHNYGWYLCRLRRYPEALAQFDAALAQPQARGQSKTLLARGVCQARAGDWVGAEKTLQRSYELDAGNPATAINLAEVLLRRGEFERARFYVARVNAVPAYADAETLWLAARIEQRRGNREGVDEFGAQLRKRYPTSPQATAYEQGKFDDQ
jgi:type IV pilus assembly protein PilF